MGHVDLPDLPLSEGKVQATLQLVRPELLQVISQLKAALELISKPLAEHAPVGQQASLSAEAPNGALATTHAARQPLGPVDPPAPARATVSGPFPHEPPASRAPEFRLSVGPALPSVVVPRPQVLAPSAQGLALRATQAPGLPVPGPDPAHTMRPTAPAVPIPAPSMARRLAAAQGAARAPVARPGPLGPAAGAAAQPLRSVAAPQPAQPLAGPAPATRPSPPQSGSDNEFMPVPAAAAPPPLGSGWKEVFVTEPFWHNEMDITSIACTDFIPNLHRGEADHAGWLLTSSPGMLNMWECSKSSGRGADSVSISHQVETGLTMMSMDADPHGRILYGASHETGGRSHCVSMHSLDGTSLLVPQGRLPLPAPNMNKSVVPQTTNLHGYVRSMSIMAKLQPKLSGLCLATYGSYLVAYPSAIIPGEVTKARLGILAHNSQVCALHTASKGVDVYTGAVGGEVKRWDFREPPKAACMEYKLGSPVSGIHTVGQAMLLTCNLDGRCVLWDLRQARKRVATISVPGGITKSALSVYEDTLALATDSRHLFTVDVRGTLRDVKAVTLEPLPGAVQGLLWNDFTSEIVAASRASVHFFRRF